MDVLTPQDATRFWLSRRACNDLFLLYCFDDTGASEARLRAAVRARSTRIADLRLRVRERRLAYPRWETGDFDADQFVVHALDAPLWMNVEAALGHLLGVGVPAERYAWRLHLFRGIRDAPGGAEPALVVVLQLSHALADGRRAAEIARALLTGLAGETDEAEPGDGGSEARGNGSGAVAGSVTRSGGNRVGALLGVVEDGAAEARSAILLPVAMARTVRRGLAAARADAELHRRTVAGEIPPPATGFEPTVINRPPAPTHRAVRMIVGEDLRAPGRTVTVVALTAISRALERYLAAHDASVDRLGAQVSMALPAASAAARSRNNYRDLGVDLAVAEPDLRIRADRIAAALADRRARATHPLQAARDRVTDAIPAPVLRRDIAGYPLDTVPDRISGHTVLSSVDRGPGDLAVAGGRVRFTAGFPALGAVMHLTHGLHGLGSSITLSIHADSRAVPDVDDYARLLREAIREAVAHSGR